MELQSTKLMHRFWVHVIKIESYRKSTITNNQRVCAVRGVCYAPSEIAGHQCYERSILCDLLMSECEFGVFVLHCPYFQWLDVIFYIKGRYLEYTIHILTFALIKCWYRYIKIGLFSDLSAQKGLLWVRKLIRIMLWFLSRFMS